MKITDEMVRSANIAYWKAYSLDSTQDLNDDGAEQAISMRAALEAAFATLPRGFCTKGTNCRLTDGHEGGCVR